MNDEDRIAAVCGPVPRETIARLGALAEAVAAENGRQNLISRATVQQLWERHIVDSAQLLRFDPGGVWLDLGSGAGFPGLVIAMLRTDPVILCEERRLRHEFLAQLVERFDLRHVTILGTKVERAVAHPVAAISARAFAPLDRLLRLAIGFSTEKTRWVLPKGRNAHSELETARRAWHGDFRLEPSMTDPESHIVIAERVAARRAL